MNRHVFVALAVVFGVAIEAMPQHRFQPIQFSFTAGKQDSMTTNVAAEPNTPISEPNPVPIEEATLTQEPELVLVDEPAMAETPVQPEPQTTNVEQLWQKAALNLVNIPHLLKWVSSLNPETLMTTLSKQQEAAPEPTPEVLPLVGEHQEESIFVQSQPTEHKIVTAELYETDVTTDYTPVEEPQPVQEPIQPQVIQEIIAVQPEMIEPEPTAIEETISPVEEQIEEKILDILVPEIITEPKQVEPLAEIVEIQPEPVEIQPEPVEVVEPQPEPVEVVELQPEPVEVVGQLEPVELVVDTQPEVVEEIIPVQPEVVEEIIPVQPDPVETAPLPQTNPIEEVPVVQPELSWYQPNQFTQTAKKSTFVDKKFKSSKYDNRRQSLKKGKTLFSFTPAQQDLSTSNFESFVFPAYSYSISHTPSHTFYSGR